MRIAPSRRSPGHRPERPWRPRHSTRASPTTGASPGSRTACSMRRSAACCAGGICARCLPPSSWRAPGCGYGLGVSGGHRSPRCMSRRGRCATTSPTPTVSMLRSPKPLAVTWRGPPLDRADHQTTSTRTNHAHQQPTRALQAHRQPPRFPRRPVTMPTSRRSRTREPRADRRHPATAIGIVPASA